MTRVSVVVPNYNGRNVLPGCLDALQAQTHPADEIVVVDDASCDGSIALIRERYPQVLVIDMRVNSGFCRAANAGLKAATGDLVALLNNDAEAHEDWLAELVSAMEAHPQVGFCAPKMLFYDRRDQVNSAGLFFRVDGVSRDIGFGQQDGPAFARAQPVFGASGGAAMYRRALLDDVGLFDEDLGAYSEDVDLSFRAQLRGWPCLYVPRAVVYHRVGATYGGESPIKAYLSSRNMPTVLLKNMPARLLRRHWHQIALAQVYQTLYYVSRGHGWPALRGKIDAVKGMRRTLSKRRSVQHARRVSDVHIAALLAAWGQHGRLAKEPAAVLSRHG